MGGRNLGLIPVAMSICVSIISSNTLLGAPAELYYQGIMYMFVFIPIIPGILVTAYFFVPLLYPLKLKSAHKYLKLRFGSKTMQIAGAVLLLFCQTLYIGCVIFGPATALETVTGIPAWASIILVGVIGTAYTAFGGMKAVIWTDVFQTVIMLLGTSCIIIQGSILLGGFSNIWTTNMNNGRLTVRTGTSMTERFNLLSIICGYGVFLTALFAVNQPSVQRYSAMNSMRKGQIAVILNGPGTILFTLLSTMAGMVAYAYYEKKGCDPLAARYISNGNQITPYLVMEILPYPGVPGLFVSSLFSGSLSTFSSSINSMSAVVWEDMLEDHLISLSEKKKTWITKGLSMFFGILCMGVAFVVMTIGGNLVQMAASFFGVSIGPLLGVFVLGGLVPWANWLGALVAAIVGLAVNIWSLVGQTLNKSNMQILPTRTDGCNFDNAFNETSTLASVWTDSTTHLYQNTSANYDANEIAGVPWIYRISFIWNSVIGFFLVLVIGTVLSACTLFVTKKHRYSKNLLFRGIKQFHSDDEAIAETKTFLDKKQMDEFGRVSSM